MPGGDELRSRLTLLGDRRAAHREEGEKLAREIEKAVREVRRSSRISMTEAAKLIGFDRTAIYRTYGG